MVNLRVVILRWQCFEDLAVTANVDPWSNRDLVPVSKRSDTTDISFAPLLPIDGIPWPQEMIMACWEPQIKGRNNTRRRWLLAVHLGFCSQPHSIMRAYGLYYFTEILLVHKRFIYLRKPPVVVSLFHSASLNEATRTLSFGQRKSIRRAIAVYRTCPALEVALRSRRVRNLNPRRLRYISLKLSFTA